ncbi:hypothetical protein HOH45_02470 [bacterium]|jgi:hypothetical protein|nr:hypothetical protein [bacterium]
MNQRKQIKGTVEQFEHQKRMVTYAKKNAKLAHRLFFLLFPWFLLKQWFISFISIFSEQKATTLKTLFLKDYFKKFFNLKGLPAYTTLQSEFPQTGRPMIIFTLRQNVMSSLYTFCNLPFPAVIPIQKNLDTMRTTSYLPFKGVGKYFKHISYEDGTLKSTSKNIKTLIEAGYPVVVHVNEFFIDTDDMDTLYLHRSFFDLIKLDTDIRFMTVAGYSKFKYSTFVKPTLVRIDSLKKEKFLRNTASDREIGTAVGRLFGVNNVHVID